MSAEGLRGLLISRRVRGGANPADSAALLDELVSTCGEGTLAHALHYQGFATVRGAEKAAAQLLEAVAEPSPMTDEERSIARDAGVTACRNDLPAAPGADPTILDLVRGRPVGERRTRDLFDAFAAGYREEVDREVAALGLIP